MISMDGFMDIFLKPATFDSRSLCHHGPFFNGPSTKHSARQATRQILSFLQD